MGPDHVRFRAEGSTRDISLEGVFVLTATCPPANSVIQMEVMIPLSDRTSRAQMRADMMVLRVEHDVAGNNRSGFSAVGKGFLLQTFSERASRAVAGLMNGPQEITEG